MPYTEKKACAWCAAEPCRCARCGCGCGRKLTVEFERENGHSALCSPPCPTCGEYGTMPGGDYALCTSVKCMERRFPDKE